MISFSSSGLTLNKAVLLAPMEDITDLSYRIICRDLGADMVFTEFVNADGLVRGCNRGKAKMDIKDDERPVGIQIYGNDTQSMVSSAILAAERNPTVLDINAGCWVKKVSSRGAGAGLLKDPCFMQKMIGQVVQSVDVPVTVKTRIGWSEDSINIVEVAKRLEDVGVKMLTVHCRTRAAGHSGEPDWKWIDRVKEVVSIPVIVNGGIMSAEDALRAFVSTKADGIMVARGAIGKPWIFTEIKELLMHGKVKTFFGLSQRIALCKKHLQRSIALKGEMRAIPAFRKYYHGYLKGFENVAKFRIKLMQASSFFEVEELLENFVRQRVSA